MIQQQEKRWRAESSKTGWRAEGSKKGWRAESSKKGWRAEGTLEHLLAETGDLFEFELVRRTQQPGNIVVHVFEGKVQKPPTRNLCEYYWWSNLLHIANTISLTKHGDK